jgi:hypothetical protein
MGPCGAHKTLTCGRGYDMVTCLGSPGSAFFRTFGFAGAARAAPVLHVDVDQ